MLPLGEEDAHVKKHEINESGRSASCNREEKEDRNELGRKKTP